MLSQAAAPIAGEHKENPSPGALFVRPTPDGSGVFVVGRDRPHPQVTYDTSDEALDHATRTASRFNVDLWHAVALSVL
jgi:hypothetical protein